MKHKERWKKEVYKPREGREMRNVKWFRLRRRVLKRDHYQCKMCKRVFDEGTLVLQPHHIKPRSEGGTNNMGNLISLCGKPCHDIAEEEQLTKKEILYYKDTQREIRVKEQANSKEWRKWVYGGLAKPI